MDHCFLLLPEGFSSVLVVPEMDALLHVQRKSWQDLKKYRLSYTDTFFMNVLNFQHLL